VNPFAAIDLDISTNDRFAPTAAVRQLTLTSCSKNPLRVSLKRPWHAKEGAIAYGANVIGIGATAEIQARSRNDICSMFEVLPAAKGGGHTWFRPFCFAA
jgi:hypothetical protein